MTFVAIVLSWLVSADVGARQAPVAPAVGFVLSLDGPWQLNGRDVKRGEGVPARAHLVLASSARFDVGRDYSLDIVLLNNHTVSCHSAEACKAGLTVPESLNQDPSVFTRMAAVFARIFETPDRWVGLVSRGAPSRLDLADAVIRTNGRTLTLGRLLERVPAGRYTLTFLPAIDTTPASKAYALPSAWTRTPPSTVPAPVPPGLYMMTIRPDTPKSAPGREAWVLVADEPHVADAARAFDDAVAMTRSWGPDVPPNDVTRFLHAFLADLAAGMK